MALGPLLGSCLTDAPSWVCCGFFRGLCTARSLREYWQPGLISGHLLICTFSPEAHGRPGAALQLGIGSVNRAGSDWSLVGSLFPSGDTRLLPYQDCEDRSPTAPRCPVLPCLWALPHSRLQFSRRDAGRQTPFSPLAICITEDTIPASKVLHSAGAPGIIRAIIMHCDAPNDRYINMGCFGRSWRST